MKYKFWSKLYTSLNTGIGEADRRPRIWVHAMRYNRDGSAVVRTGSVEIRWLASPPLDPWRTIV